MSDKASAVLLISCPDQKGLVAAIADFLYQDAELGLFLMRVEWDLSGFDLDLSRFDEAFQPIATRFQMQWRLADTSYRPRLAIPGKNRVITCRALAYRKSGTALCQQDGSV